MKRPKYVENIVNDLSNSDFNFNRDAFILGMQNCYKYGERNGMIRGGIIGFATVAAGFVAVKRVIYFTKKHKKESS